MSVVALLAKETTMMQSRDWVGLVGDVIAIAMFLLTLLVLWRARRPVRIW